MTADPDVRGALVVRRATRDDLDGIERIERDAFASRYERFNRRQIARSIANPRGRVMVGEVGGRVQGWSALLLRVEGRALGARLYGIAVHPDAAGRGIGRKLAADGLAWARERGAIRVTLEVRVDNTPAIALYRSLGFVETDRLIGYYTTADAYRMRCPLG